MKCDSLFWIFYHFFSGTHRLIQSDLVIFLVIFERHALSYLISPSVFHFIRQGKVRVAQTACGVVKAERLRGLQRSTRRYIRNVALNQARLRYAVVRRSCVGRASISARERAIHRQKKQECLAAWEVSGKNTTVIIFGQVDSENDSSKGYLTDPATRQNTSYNEFTPFPWADEGFETGFELLSAITLMIGR